MFSPASWWWVLLVVVLGAGSAGREKRGSRRGLVVRVPRVQGVRSGGERSGYRVRVPRAGGFRGCGVPRVQGSGYRVGG